MKVRSARALLAPAIAALLLAVPLRASGQGQPQQQATPNWDSFPTMLLERVYRGPLRDTVVQRWRDPIDGTVCFLYIPMSAPLLPPQSANQPYVHYGPNTIGSLSCVHPTQMVQVVGPAQQPPRPASPAAPVR